LYAAEENLGMRFFVEEDEDQDESDKEDWSRDGDADASSNSELLYAKLWDGIGA
jgi:hypothetical protein